MLLLESFLGLFHDGYVLKDEEVSLDDLWTIRRATARQQHPARQALPAKDLIPLPYSGRATEILLDGNFARVYNAEKGSSFVALLKGHLVVSDPSFSKSDDATHMQDTKFDLVSEFWLLEFKYSLTVSLSYHVETFEEATAGAGAAQTAARCCIWTC